VFARELLANGGGIGDVRVRHGLITSIELDGPTEQIALRLSVTWVEQFIGYTQDVLPLGSEPDLTELEDWTTGLTRLVEGR
jgi:hypothetical protein